MSVFVCECGRKTTEPFLINGERYCTVCAEDINPQLVMRRERSNLRKYGAKREHSPGFDLQSWDFGKHR